MARVLSDKEIADLLAEPKPVTRRFRSVIAPRQRRSNRMDEIGRRLRIVSDRKRRFLVWSKMDQRWPNKFSIGLVWLAAAGERVDLVRLNGWHPVHVNTIEGTSIPAGTCHVHIRTERYARTPRKEMGYAEACTQFNNFQEAVSYFFSKFGFYLRDHKYRHEQPLWDGIE
jgi:hypothetical protein